MLLPGGLGSHAWATWLQRSGNTSKKTLDCCGRVSSPAAWGGQVSSLATVAFCWLVGLALTTRAWLPSGYSLALWSGLQQVHPAAVPGGIQLPPTGPDGEGRALGFGLTPLPIAWGGSCGVQRGVVTPRVWALPPLPPGWEGRPGSGGGLPPELRQKGLGGGRLSLRGSAGPLAIGPSVPCREAVGGEAPTLSDLLLRRWGDVPTHPCAAPPVYGCVGWGSRR